MLHKSKIAMYIIARGLVSSPAQLSHTLDYFKLCDLYLAFLYENKLLFLYTLVLPIRLCICQSFRIILNLRREVFFDEQILCLLPLLTNFQSGVHYATESLCMMVPIPRIMQDTLSFEPDYSSPYTMLFRGGNVLR